MAQPHGTAKVISIRSFSGSECRPSSVITQQKLREGAELLELQRRVTESLHKFRMEVENELASGADIEDGALTFDRELKIVRPRRPKTTKILQVSAR
jgi:hypothetical protein